jgi:hypothetical protein
LKSPVRENRTPGSVRGGHRATGVPTSTINLLPAAVCHPRRPRPRA